MRIEYSSLPRAAHDDVRYQARPACLMAGAKPGAGIPMEVLIEEHIVMPIGMGLHTVVVAETRAIVLCVVAEKVDEAIGEKVGGGGES